MKISRDALWVVSPLTRALETLLLACPMAHKIGSSDKPLNLIVQGLVTASPPVEFLKGVTVI